MSSIVGPEGALQEGKKCGRAMFSLSLLRYHTNMSCRDSFACSQKNGQQSCPYQTDSFVSNQSVFLEHLVIMWIESSSYLQEVWYLSLYKLKNYIHCGFFKFHKHLLKIDSVLVHYIENLKKLKVFEISDKQKPSDSP